METVNSADQSPRFRATQAWLRSPVGDALLTLESRLVEEALNGLFGAECLQLGTWGEPHRFVKFARTQHTTCIGGPIVRGTESTPDAFGRMHRLPVASDSIDVAILPHTLDYSERPAEILREVHRILRSDGHLVVLGFARGGPWGLRRLLPGAGIPPHTGDLVGDGRLSEWLTLLDLRIQQRIPYFFKLPVQRRQIEVSPHWEERGRRWWPELAACYMLTAQKRLYTMTPIRKPWRSRPKVVGGLVEPTTRVSRIRLDPKS